MLAPHAVEFCVADTRVNRGKNRALAIGFDQSVVIAGIQQHRCGVCFVQPSTGDEVSDLECGMVGRSVAT